MIRILTLSEKKAWDFYVQNSYVHDFYHTWQYHTLDNNGQAILVVYEKDGDYIAFPFLKREIPQSTFFDLCSVYGYVGPISNKNDQNLSAQFIDDFRTAFLNLLKNEQIVSVFSRLHPFFTQEKLMASFKGVYENGKTVALDLSIPIETQRKKYKESTFSSIKKSWRKGLVIKETKEIEDIDAFIEIYEENMERIQSTESYLFDRQYFIDLINSNEFDCRLLLVYFEDEVISGTLITLTHGIIQGHLIATKSAYLRDSPAKFLVDQVTVLGRKEGMKYMNLGGGLGYKQDTLFGWKAGFSDLFLDHKSWRYVVNDSVYHDLVCEQGIDCNANIDFFPLYRAIG